MEEPVERQATATGNGPVRPVADVSASLALPRVPRGSTRHSPAGLVDNLVHAARSNSRGMALDVRHRHAGSLQNAGGQGAVLPRSEGEIRCQCSVRAGAGRTSDSSSGCRGERLSGCELARRARTLRNVFGGTSTALAISRNAAFGCSVSPAMICSRRDAGSTGRTLPPRLTPTSLQSIATEPQGRGASSSTCPPARRASALPEPASPSAPRSTGTPGADAFAAAPPAWPTLRGQSR
jgi:hypothetical protein